MRAAGGAIVALVSLAVALALVGSSPVTALAQEPRPKLIVGVSDSPDPAASGGPVIYAITVKNDGTTKALNVLVTIPLPTNTSLVKCTMVLIEGSSSTPCTPGLANNTVAVYLGKIKAHNEPRITLTLTMPTVSVASPVMLEVNANGDDVDDDTGRETTTVLPPGSFVTYLPSGRVGPIVCGDTLTPEAYGTDTTAQLSGPLGCTSGPWGLKITASDKTLDLNKFNIFWNAAPTKGSVGILVSNATGVTIVGGSVNTGSGIELFDWCVKDEGQSKKLSINTLRCFKARTAGIDVASKKVLITGVKIDRVAGTATTTAELPGGVGIRTRAEKAQIKDSRVLKASTVGIWLAGVDIDGDGVVAQINGSNTSKMRIENSARIGLLLDGGPHRVKDMLVQGDGLTGPDKDGVVIGPTGVNNLLDGVVVKKHGGNGFVVDGTGTHISRSEVEDIGLDGFVVAGSGSVLSGNSVTEARHGFIVSGPATCETGLVCNELVTNEAFKNLGDGYIVTGAGVSLTNNDSEGNGGVAYRIGGDGGFYETNVAQKNGHHGFVITGNDNTFKGNTSEDNAGAGFKVPGTGNHFNSNAASINDGVGEWVIGPGQIEDGGKTNKSNGKVFSIPAEGGIFNTIP